MGFVKFAACKRRSWLDETWKLEIMSDLRNSIIHPVERARYDDETSPLGWRTSGLDSVRAKAAFAPGKDPGPAYEFLQRGMDVTGAIVGLALLLPLLLGLAIAVKASSPGPVFFKQKRYGKGRALFTIYKFRTMRNSDADASGIAQTVAGDKRVTRIGSFMRKTSFDELPQLINVLKGDMSIVGPRPHVPGMLANGVLYEDFDARYVDRSAVRPGITGLAQVSGFRGETCKEYPARMRLEYDLLYIQNRSIWLDIKIVLATLKNEFIRGSGY